MSYRLILLFSLILFSACNKCNNHKRIIDVSNNNLASSSTNSYILDSIDYAVINEAIYQCLIIPPSLAHRFNNYNQEKLQLRHAEIKLYVLIDSTSVIHNDYMSVETLDFIIEKHKLIDSTDEGWIRTISERNFYPAFIDSTMLKHLHYRMIATSKFKELFSDVDGWSKFWSIYSYPSLIITISIPAYNKTRDKALVYVDYASTGKSGEGNYIWLKQIDGKWISYDIIFVWVS